MEAAERQAGPAPPGADAEAILRACRGVPPGPGRRRRPADRRQRADPLRRARRPARPVLLRARSAHHRPHRPRRRGRTPQLLHLLPGHLRHPGDRRQAPSWRGLLHLRDGAATGRRHPRADDADRFVRHTAPPARHEALRGDRRRQRHHPRALDPADHPCRRDRESLHPGLRQPGRGQHDVPRASWTTSRRATPTGSGSSTCAPATRDTRPTSAVASTARCSTNGSAPTWP